MNLRRKLTITEIVSTAILFLALLLCVMVLFTFSGVPRSHARHTTCSSNQKQIMTATLMMLEENEHLLLPADKEVWQIAVEWAGKKRVLVCPEFTRSKEGRAKKGDVLGYGYNAKLIGKKMSDFEDPTAIIFTADANTADNLIKSISDIDFNRHTRDHKKNAVVSFLDGHISSTDATSKDIFLEPQKQKSDAKR